MEPTMPQLQTNKLIEIVLQVYRKQHVAEKENLSKI